MAQGIPFGEYQLLRRLGAGGMAEVFLAKRAGPRGFEKQLVIKRILPHLTASARFTSMFLNEARVAALIDHPNLVHVSSFGEIDGNYYLAMEYVDGITVSELLRLVGCLTAGVACRIAVDLLEALQAIHTAKDKDGQPLQLVHRDVSPRNIMLTRSGAVKLLDFGIAISGGQADGPQIGTRRYMSPEQLLGESLDARSDLFCAGVVLYEMIAGQPPFDGAPKRDLDRPDSIPKELWKTLGPVFSIDRDERPRSARAMQAQLELFLQARGVEGTRAHLAEILDSVVMQEMSFGRRTLTRITRMTRMPATGELDEGRPKSRSVAIGAGAVSLAAIGLTAALWPSDEPPMVVAPSQAAPALVNSASSTGTEVLAGAPVSNEATKAVPIDASPAGAKPENRSAVKAKPRSTPEKKRRARRRAAKSVAKLGYLTIDTRPWTEVHLGSKKLGMTPLQGVKLPTGRHKVRLVNPELGIDRVVSVTIRAGKTTRVRKRF